MSRLCHVCKTVNFTGVLTPRERDPKTGEWRAIFRPELSGNGEDPCLGWPTPGSANTTRRPRGPVPHIKAANYDSRSDSTQSWTEEHEDPPGVGVGMEAPRMGSGDMGSLAADMSSGEDSDDECEEDATYSERGEENESPHAQKYAFRTPGSDVGSSGHGRVVESERGSEAGVRSSTLRRLSDIGSSNDGPDGQGRSLHCNSRANDPAADGDPHDDDENGDEQCLSDNGTSSFTWSGDSRFDRDQKIDIQKQEQGNWTYQHGQFYNLGSIWDVRSRRYDCDLCCKLWQRMRKEWHVKNTFLRKSRCLIKLLEWKIKGNADEPNREVVVLNMLFIFGFKTGLEWDIRLSYVFHGAHTSPSNPQQTSPPNGGSLWPDELFGESRKIGSSCDFDLFRKWLACCEEEHHHDEPDTTGEFIIRLIDVHERCLVEWGGPIAKAPRFVALSYVWGRAPQPLLLTTNNIADMMEAGAFDSQVLPRTIDDAIDLVARIGERYLWVDALCILQDSSEDKSIQIPQMYSIYSKATLTVVAASGEDADAGLPGVRSDPRRTTKFALDLEDIRVTIRATTKLWYTPYNIGFRENYLSDCKYLSRAWTMQEAFLSRRTLVFTKGQVYWECATGTWCEGTHWESSALKFIGQRAIKESTPVDVWEDNFDRQAYDIITDAETVTYEVKPDSYECLVREYTGRELSYDRDILNAFTGILSLIEKREQTLFFFALRERHFGNDLLFNIMTAIPRRFTVQEGRVPSWSWLAWKGTTEFANEVRNSSSDLVNNLVPCDGVKCHVLDVDDCGQKCLRIVNETGGWRFNSTYVRRGEGIYNPTSFYMSKPTSATDDIFDLVQAAQGREKVSEWMTNLDTEPKDSQKQTGDISDQETEPSDLSTKYDSRDTEENRKPRIESPRPDEDIPVYSQTLTIADIQSHKAFQLLQPNFHIIFYTFSSSVELITEEDESMKLFSKMVMGGTKRHRRNGVNSNRDIIQRNLYICTKAQDEGTHSSGNRRPRAEDRILAMLKMRQAQRTRGPYFGRLPPLSKAWDVNEYMEAVPDGRYTVLWMNNNQLPMFGHLLCRPSTSSSGRGYGDGVLERVCGVLGPTEILSKQAQEKWKAKWGCHVLG